VALIIHESAHALAVKSYGRKVTRGGFMLMMGMPFAFVDTSDMWFGTRWSRIVVTLSGPLSTAALAGGIALGAAYVPDPAVSGVCFQLAFGLYLNTLYNVNPVMPLDGYQALSDVLRRPRLREEATAYFTRGLWRDLRQGRRPRMRQLGLAAYGLTALVGMVLFAVMAVVAWRSRLGGLVQDYVKPPLDVLLVSMGIGLALFPIWFRLMQKVISLRRRRARERALTVAATTPAEATA
jgi:putative peptide zinc metalloprotease protein